MELTMTGNLADLVGAEPEDLLLYPAECADSSGTRFVLRSRDDEPWAPVSFSQLADGTPYLYMSGRVAPRVSLGTTGARMRNPPRHEESASVLSGYAGILRGWLGLCGGSEVLGCTGSTT
jgi:hypothetical protein